MKCLQCDAEVAKIGEFWSCPTHGRLPTPKPCAPLRIFLSHSRDSNEDLVRRIKADLEERGHDVRLDKDEVKGGHDWRRPVTDYLDESQRKLPFLSKHPTRAPGICLDAIAVAIGVKGAYIQTILVESDPDVLRPVNTGHIAWLDMHVWTKRRLAGEAMWQRWYQAKFAEIVRVVEGEESRRFADEIQALDGHLSVDRAEDSPEGLDEILRRYFQRQFPDLEKFRKDVRPALCVILAALEPLPIESVQRFFNWQDEELRDITRTLASLFPVTTEANQEVIKPFHKSLADWLVDEAKAGPYVVSVEEGLRMLADFGWRDYGSGVQALCGYFLRYLPLLLFRAERTHNANRLLNDEEFHALRVCGMLPKDILIQEARQRFPAVDRFLERHEQERRPQRPEDEHFLLVNACDLDAKEASGLVASQNNYDGDIYRHWEYVTFDAVFSDGRIHNDCVSAGHSLAEVLPLFQIPPTLVIQTSHSSGQSGPGDQYGHNEFITLFRIPPSLGLLHAQHKPSQEVIDTLMSGCRPHWSADIQGYHANESSEESPPERKRP